MWEEAGPRVEEENGTSWHTRKPKEIEPNEGTTSVRGSQTREPITSQEQKERERR